MTVIAYKLENVTWHMYEVKLMKVLVIDGLLEANIYLFKKMSQVESIASHVCWIFQLISCYF